MNQKPIEQSPISNIEEKYDIPAILKKLTVEGVKEFEKIIKPYTLSVNLVFILIGGLYLYSVLQGEYSIWMLAFKAVLFLFIWVILGTTIKIKLIVGSKKFRQFVVDNDGFGHKK